MQNIGEKQIPIAWQHELYREERKRYA